MSVYVQACECAHIPTCAEKTGNAVPRMVDLVRILPEGKQQHPAVDTGALGLGPEGLHWCRHQKQLRGTSAGTDGFLGLGVQPKIPQEARESG